MQPAGGREYRLRGPDRIRHSKDDLEGNPEIGGGSHRSDSPPHGRDVLLATQPAGRGRPQHPARRLQVQPLPVRGRHLDDVAAGRLRSAPPPAANVTLPSSEEMTPSVKQQPGREIQIVPGRSHGHHQALALHPDLQRLLGHDEVALSPAARPATASAPDARPAARPPARPAGDQIGKGRAEACPSRGPEQDHDLLERLDDAPEQRQPHHRPGQHQLHLLFVVAPPPLRHHPAVVSTERFAAFVRALVEPRGDWFHRQVGEERDHQQPGHDVHGDVVGLGLGACRARSGTGGCSSPAPGPGRRPPTRP